MTAGGPIVRLWRYPVKSMLGEVCEALTLDARGVAGDRVYAVRDGGGKFGSGKSTRRFRRIDGLFRFSAAYAGDVPRITFPDGRAMAGDDPRIHAELSDALGQPVTLAREAGVSHLDAGPVHVLTTASLAWLRERLPSASIDERRFRPNVLVDVPGAAQAERLWVGRTLAIGGVRLKVHEFTERCVMVGMAQNDLADDPRVLRSIADESGLDFGVYAEVVVPGLIARHDRVTLVD